MTSRACGTRVPVRCGIGLRAPHYGEVIHYAPGVPWVEVHSENYFGAGGPPLRYLERVRERCPVSLHGVGMSLGSTDPIDSGYLEKLRSLIARIDPSLVSDHLSWSSIGQRHFNDLLPLPYNCESWFHVRDRIEQVQELLGRQILIENPSTYLEYAESEIPEWEFLNALAASTGCGLLLDVNNVHVSARNNGGDAQRFVDAIDGCHVVEIHLAGFTRNETDAGEILIDTHSTLVSPEVWDLYRRVIRRIGARPTLVEWDADLPVFAVLLEEMERAESILGESDALAA